MKGFLFYSRECVDENRFRVKLLLTLEHDLPINFFGIYLGKKWLKHFLHKSWINLNNLISSLSMLNIKGLIKIVWLFMMCQGRINSWYEIHKHKFLLIFLMIIRNHLFKERYSNQNCIKICFVSSHILFKVLYCIIITQEQHFGQEFFMQIKNTLIFETHSSNIHHVYTIILLFDQGELYMCLKWMYKSN